jgi:hypothetical protein
MNTQQELFKLPFDPVMQLVEAGMVSFPLKAQYGIVMRDFVGYLLEELSVKISDRDATSHIDMAVAYLKRNYVEEEYAARFSHHVFEAVMDTVLGYFPTISFQSLAAARYVLDQDNATLLVYMQITYT